MNKKDNGMAKRKRIFAAGEGSKEMKNLLGGKGANLQEMHNLGMPVPAFFTIDTETCREFYSADDKTQFFNELVTECGPYIKQIEQVMGRIFGATENPLLVSLRSGAAVSMPGMMDTILNLGLSDANLEGLAKSFYAKNLSKTSQQYQAQKQIADWFSLDAYRTLLVTFGTAVFEDKKKSLEEGFGNVLKEVKTKVLGRKGPSEKPLTVDDIKDTDLTIADMKEVVQGYKDVYRKNSLGDVVEECFENKDANAVAYAQFRCASEGVFRSSQSPRAIVYKLKENQPEDLGTALNVQGMVFGNLGSNSATGVLFTRNDATGEKADSAGNRVLYGDWLQNAQGEAVVAGIRIPNKIADLEKLMPKQYKQLYDIALELEQHYRDVQDIEFTIEDGKLWMLQTRAGKRAAQASLVCALDMVDEGLITKKEALLRFSPADMEALLHDVFDPDADKTYITKGIAAGPGDASGIIALTPEYAIELASKDYKVILVRAETKPEDVAGMFASKGICTKIGGPSCHAAIVGKQYNKAVVAGAKELEITEGREKGTGTLKIGSKTYKEGEDYISISGTTGEIFEGKVSTIRSEIERVVKGELSESESGIWSYYKKMREYATGDKHVKELKNRLGVRANSDTPVDASAARLLGAEGIGLLRTEHTMFEEAEQRYAMREMILASDTESRMKALEAVEALQTRNFYEVFKVMDTLPVTVRLLDPPLDEFLPGPEGIKSFVNSYKQKHGGSESEITDMLEKRLEDLKEANPMMGFRGNRLGVVHPEIIEMQARSIFNAMYQLRKEGHDPKVEIMAPVTICEGELSYTKGVIDKVRQEVDKEHAPSKLDIGKVHYGTMIETPRAAIHGKEIAAGVAEFFSFGTNDLTQGTLMVDRSSAGSYLNMYVEEGWLEHPPFVTIDVSGVGHLVEKASVDGRKANPNLKLGICGEHGGDPKSIEFFHSVGGAGLDYVSCGAYKIPVAIIAAAHAQLKSPR